MANPSTAQIQAWIVAAAAQYGVDSSLALGVAQQESGFNPDALSSAGAIGVMQLEPSTAIQLGVDPTDPQQNIYGGVHYLAMLLSEFGGDEVAALAAYNWGPGAVSNAQNEYGPTWLAMAPAETQNYVSRILGVSAASYEAMESPLAPAAAAVAATTSTDAEDIDSADEDAALLSSIGVSTSVPEPPAPTLANWLASLPSWAPYVALAAGGVAAFMLVE